VSALGERRPAADEGLDVELVVGQLGDLRKLAQRRRYRGAPPKLPARETAIALIDELVAALYPRHFGPRELAPDEVDDFVARTLHSALRALEMQVRLEFQLHAERVGAPPSDPRRAAAVVAEFAADLPRVRALADSDARAGFDGDPSAGSIDEIVFYFPGFAAVLRHRLAHGLYRLGAPMLARIIAEDAHTRTGVDIHPGAEIGERFFIDHGTGVVIGETAVIGRNVRLYQAVTLGAKRFDTDPATGGLRKNYPRHPIVEDDVVIYAGATILGRIRIGKGSSIGGNVWLTHDVPAGSQITQARARGEPLRDADGTQKIDFEES
jgi:serine O-acetyltransferase